MALGFQSIFAQVYSSPGTIRRDVLRNLRLGNRDAQILEFLMFFAKYNIPLKTCPLQISENSKATDPVYQKSIALGLDHEAAQWHVYLRGNPKDLQNFQNKEEVFKYFRENMLKTQDRNKVKMKDNQLNEFNRLLVAALLPLDENTKKHVQIFEKIYIDFLSMDRDLVSQYGGYRKGSAKPQPVIELKEFDTKEERAEKERQLKQRQIEMKKESEAEKKAIQKSEKMILKLLEEQYSKEISGMPPELIKQVIADVGGVARAVTQKRSTFFRKKSDQISAAQDKVDKKVHEFGKAYKYLIEVEMLLKSIETPELLKTKEFNKIIKHMERLYQKKSLSLLNVGLLVFRIYFNKEILFGKKVEGELKFKKITIHELREKFQDFVLKELFNEKTDSKIFKNSENFEKFQKLNKNICLDIIGLKVLKPVERVSKKVMLRAQKVADAFGVSAPGLLLNKEQFHKKSKNRFVSSKKESALIKKRKKKKI